MRISLPENRHRAAVLAALLAVGSCGAGLEDEDGADVVLLDEAVDSSECEVGDRSVLGAATGHCYAFVAAAATWSEAAAACGSLGPGFHLATVTGPGEARLVAQLVGDADAWLGGSDTDAEGTWAWATGELVDYEIWEPGLPDDFDGADCLAMRGIDGLGVWFDRACSSANAFVCERD